jgi:hypothetical protein
LAATEVAGVPETLGLAAWVLVAEGLAAVLPASLEPPQAARVTLTLRIARPWPSTRRIFLLFMSLASLSGENP